MAIMGRGYLKNADTRETHLMIKNRLVRVEPPACCSALIARVTEPQT